MENRIAAKLTRKHLDDAISAIIVAKVQLRTSPDWILAAEITDAMHVLEDEEERLRMLVDECEAYAQRA